MLELSEEQVLWFRARRGHLAGPGATSAAAAARAILGAQSQQLPPSLFGLSARTKGRPSAASLRRQLFGGTRRLVRTWGQRETLHVYDPGAHWALVASSREVWAPGGRRGPMPGAGTIDEAWRVVRAAGRPVTRSDLVGVAPKSYERAIAEIAGQASLSVERLAAARLIWQLALRGDLCLGEDVDRERSYATRSDWFPRLAWDPPPGVEAATELAQQYLATFGPATTTDVAHFFGARVQEAKVWIEALRPVLIDVACGGRKGLVALKRDARQLTPAAPKRAAEWPVRFLPLWDGALMGHKDKRWLVPEVGEEKLVWRKAAYVAATVIARGRIVATWTHRERAKAVDVELTPLSGWRSSHLPGARREAKALAAHLGRAQAELTIRS